MTELLQIRPNPTLLQPRPQPMSQEARIADALMHPVKFSTFFLQTDIWDVQADIMDALTREPRVAVKACHASSKTFTAAQVLLWWLARYQDCVIVTTAPTWTQVEKLLWGEVHAALLKSRYPFPKPLTTELRLGPKRYAYGLSTSVTKQDEGVKFQGIHGDHVLVIIDEAPGVDPKIWEAVEGARAGGNVCVLAIGNPTITGGPFYDAFTTTRSGWKVFTIDAFDTPNLKSLPGKDADEKLQSLLKMGNETPEILDDNITPYLTTRRWVFEKFYEWGPDHPSWQSRVRGQFPKQSEWALLSLTWLEQAALREMTGAEPCTAGIDVAGPGEDETSLTVRKGPRVVLHQQWPHPDPRGELVAALNQFKHELEVVNIDSVGIGWGIYTHLTDLKFPTRPIIAQENSSDPEKFADIKAEFYWGFRLRCQAGDFCGLTDDKTIGQLAGIRYKHNSRGQVEIESKDDARKRGVKSPDRAESVMLAFARQTAIYGVLEAKRQEAEEMQKIAASTLMKPTMSENQARCPKCSETCCSRTNGGWRCNACGEQWWDGKPTVINPVSRTEMLAKFGRR